MRSAECPSSSFGFGMAILMCYWANYIRCKATVRLKSDNARLCASEFFV